MALPPSAGNECNLSRARRGPSFPLPAAIVPPVALPPSAGNECNLSRARRGPVRRSWAPFLRRPSPGRLFRVWPFLRQRVQRESRSLRARRDCSACGRSSVSRDEQARDERDSSGTRCRLGPLFSGSRPRRDCRSSVSRLRVQLSRTRRGPIPPARRDNLEVYLGWNGVRVQERQRWACPSRVRVRWRSVRSSMRRRARLPRCGGART